LVDWDQVAETRGDDKKKPESNGESQKSLFE